MRRLKYGLVGLAVLAVPSMGQARQVSAEAPPFQIVQMATTNPEKFYAEWAKPTPGVKLEAQTTAKRGQVLQTFLLFKGCKADAKGDCQLSADYLVTDPEGKTYADQKDVDVWRGKPAPPLEVFQLSLGNMALRFEPKDPLGGYTVRIAVTDRVSGVTLRTEQVLTATD
jgi:hypothetical protein